MMIILKQFQLILFYLSASVLTWINPAGAQERTVKVAIPAVNMSVISFSTAVEKGFYRDEGLSVELIQMPATIGTRSLIAGETHFAAVGGSTMPAVIQGAPLRFLFSTFNRPMYWLYSRPDVKDIKSLKGKRVSVSGIGSGPDSLLRAYLKRHGLEAGKDLTIVGVGSNPTLLASLQNNTVDASMLSPPFTFLAEETGFRELLSFVKQDRVEVQGSVVVRNELLDSDPLLVEKFLRATLRGFYVARNNRSDAIFILAKTQNIKNDLAAKTYDVTRPAMTADGTLNREEQEKALEAALDRLKLKDPAPVEKVFDYSLARKINVELKGKGVGSR